MFYSFLISILNFGGELVFDAYGKNTFFISLSDFKGQKSAENTKIDTSFETHGSEFFGMNNINLSIPGCLIMSCA